MSEDKEVKEVTDTYNIFMVYDLFHTQAEYAVKRCYEGGSYRKLYEDLEIAIVFYNLANTMSTSPEKIPKIMEQLKKLAKALEDKEKEQG